MSVKISVIIPIYNMENYLSECLDSVIGQTLKDIEIICVDDGSTDGTGSILKEYNQKHSNMITIWQKRKGVGAARNMGMKNAKGEFFAFMDPDDFYPTNDVLEILYSRAIKNNVKAVGGNFQINFEGIQSSYVKNRFEKDEILRFKDYQNCFGFTAFIYSGEMLKENDIFFPLYVRGQDPIFMLKALTCADKIYVTSKEVYVIRVIDKKVKFNSGNVMCDLAKGLYDVIHFSRQQGYTSPIEEMVSDAKRWKNYFFIHILNGNQELYSIMKKMDQDITASGHKKNSSYYFDASINDIKDYIYQYSARMKEVFQIMKQYKEIIIYGAGRVGKSIYDIIEQREELCFSGFAVSIQNPDLIVREHRVYCIEHYLDKKSKALIVIAGEQRVAEDMKKNAIRLGFLNTIVIDEEVVDIENFKIIDDKFAV